MYVQENECFFCVYVLLLFDFNVDIGVNIYWWKKIHMPAFAFA